MKMQWESQRDLESNSWDWMQDHQYNQLAVPVEAKSFQRPVIDLDKPKRQIH